MTKELVRHSHSVGESNIHYQFTPAYRKPVFKSRKIRKLVEAYLLAKAKELNIIIVAVDFGPDHIHIFVANCKNYSALDLARRLKGFISNMMRKNHWNLFRLSLWGKKFWTAGYFYRSVGSVTTDAIEFYVKHSQEKHWEVTDFEFYKYDNQKRLSEF